jgi:hypothetical protein
MVLEGCSKGLGYAFRDGRGPHGKRIPVGIALSIPDVETHRHCSRGFKDRKDLVISEFWPIIRVFKSAFLARPAEISINLKTFNVVNTQLKNSKKLSAVVLSLHI